MNALRPRQQQRFQGDIVVLQDPCGQTKYSRQHEFERREEAAQYLALDLSCGSPSEGINYQRTALIN